MSSTVVDSHLETWLQTTSTAEGRCSLASLGDCPVEVIKNCQWFMTLDPLRRDTCQEGSSIHKADTWEEDLSVCADFLDKQSLTSWVFAEFDAPYMLEISSPCRSLFFLPSVVAAWRHYQCPLALFGWFDDVWGVDKLLTYYCFQHPPLITYACSWMAGTLMDVGTAQVWLQEVQLFSGKPFSCLDLKFLMQKTMWREWRVGRRC